MIKTFRDLEVYQESYRLMLVIHQEVNKFPYFEKNDLGSQMRRCSKSVPANIAEGWAKRRFEKEFKKHLEVSIGSTNEMEVHIEIAKDLGYWNNEFSQKLITDYRNLGGKLANLRDNWKTY